MAINEGIKWSVIVPEDRWSPFADEPHEPSDPQVSDSTNELIPNDETQESWQPLKMPGLSQIIDYFAQLPAKQRAFILSLIVTSALVSPEIYSQLTDLARSQTTEEDFSRKISKAETVQPRSSYANYLDSLRHAQAHPEYAQTYSRITGGVVGDVISNYCLQRFNQLNQNPDIQIENVQLSINFAVTPQEERYFSPQLVCNPTFLFIQKNGTVLRITTFPGHERPTYNIERQVGPSPEGANDEQLTHQDALALISQLPYEILDQPFQFELNEVENMMDLLDELTKAGVTNARPTISLDKGTNNLHLELAIPFENNNIEGTAIIKTSADLDGTGITFTTTTNPSGLKIPENLQHILNQATDSVLMAEPVVPLSLNTEIDPEQLASIADFLPPKDRPNNSTSSNQGEVNIIGPGDK